MGKSKRKRGKKVVSIGAEKVRALLERRPVTWLAEQSGVSKHKIYDWLAGRGKIYPWEVHKIAGVFKADPADLIDEPRKARSPARDQGLTREPPPGNLGFDGKSVDDAADKTRPPKKRRRLR